MTASVHVVSCRNLCCALPRVHEVDVATQLGLNGGQLLHALLHLHMKLQDKAHHHQCCTLFQLVYQVCIAISRLVQMDSDVCVCERLLM